MQNVCHRSSIAKTPSASTCRCAATAASTADSATTRITARYWILIKRFFRFFRFFRSSNLKDSSTRVLLTLLILKIGFLEKLLLLLSYWYFCPYFKLWDLFWQVEVKKPMSSSSIVIILTVFCLTLFGMCFSCIYNCVRKLKADHHDYQVHKLIFI